MLPLLLVAAVQPPVAVAPPPRPANPFAKWEKEVAAIEKRLAESPPSPGGVVFAGSSTIRLWDLNKSFPGAGYVNVGFGGSVIADCTHFAPRLVTRFKPKTVVFYAGDNDIGGNRTPQQVLADFQAFCAAVHKDVPTCRVLFLAVKPSIARWKKFDDQKVANGLVKAWCAADDRLGYVDTVPLMLGPDGMPAAELFVKDGLHLSPAGYERWTAAVKAALK